MSDATIHRRPPRREGSPGGAASGYPGFTTVHGVRTSQLQGLEAGADAADMLYRRPDSYYHQASMGSGAQLQQAVTHKSQLLAHALQRRHASIRSSQDLQHRNFKASAELLSIRSLTSSQRSLRRGSGLKRPHTPGPLGAGAATARHMTTTSPTAASGFSAADLLASLSLSPLPAAAALPISAPRHTPGAAGAPSNPPLPQPAPNSTPSAEVTVSHIAAKLTALHELGPGASAERGGPGQWWLQTVYPLSDPLACEMEMLALDLSGTHTQPSQPACMATQYAGLFALRLDVAVIIAGTGAGPDAFTAPRAGAGPHAGPPQASRAALTAAVEEILAPVGGVQLDPRSTAFTVTAGPGRTVAVATGVANIVSAMCSAAQRRLPQDAWLNAVTAFVHSCTARGPPFAARVCGHPQKFQEGAATEHDVRQCPRCCVLVCMLRSLKATVQGAMQGVEAGPLVSPGPAEPLLPLLLERCEHVMTMGAIARARWLESDPKGFCRMFHAGGDVRTAFLWESGCAVEVYRLLQLQPQQLQLANDLWQMWRSCRRRLDAFVRTANAQLGTLVSSTELYRHAGMLPAAPAARPPPAPPPSPQPPAFARPRGPGPRRNTLPPLHSDLLRPPAASRSPGGGMMGGRRGSGSGSGGRPGSSPERCLRRFSSGGSVRSSAAGCAGLVSSGLLAELSPGATPIVAHREPCTCVDCMSALAQQLLGVGADVSAAAQASIRTLRSLQSEDLTLCAQTILSVNVPGAFFSAEQMLAASAAAMRYGLAAVDWMWVLRMASQQLHSSGSLASFEDIGLEDLL
eukprot:jgi/Ulvmu1/2783/UM140_0013.1